MKKIFIFIIGIFSIFLFNNNVYALTYDKCGESIQVNESNFIYYIYKYNTELFNNSDYFVLLKYGDNSGYTIYYSLNNFLLKDNVQSYNVKNAYRVRYGNNFNDLNNNSTYGDSLQSFSAFNHNFVYSNYDIPIEGSNNVISKNISKLELQNYFRCSIPTYTISYYLNNELYNSIDAEENSSHTLLYYEPSIEYEFSGWSYDSNIDLTNITSNVNIYGTTTLKPTYTISYYLNNELYDSVSLLKGSNYTLQDYTPPKYYTFSGWSYDSNIDLTNITSNVNIYGTTEYVRPNIEYTEETDSIIHNITLKIVGEGVPQEFDFVYQIFDFLVLLVIVLTILAPFILLFKLLGVI